MRLHGRGDYALSLRFCEKNPKSAIKRDREGIEGIEGIEKEIMSIIAGPVDLASAPG
jgi:hypothetical protein